MNKKQLDLLREAGVKVPHVAKDDSFLTAEDEELLSDLHWPMGRNGPPRLRKFKTYSHILRRRGDL